MIFDVFDTGKKSTKSYSVRALLNVKVIKKNLINIENFIVYKIIQVFYYPILMLFNFILSIKQLF